MSENIWSIWLKKSSKLPKWWRWESLSRTQNWKRATIFNNNWSCINWRQFWGCRGNRFWEIQKMLNYSHFDGMNITLESLTILNHLCKYISSDKIKQILDKSLVTNLYTGGGNPWDWHKRLVDLSIPVFTELRSAPAFTFGLTEPTGSWKYLIFVFQWIFFRIRKLNILTNTSLFWFYFGFNHVKVFT